MCPRHPERRLPEGLGVSPQPSPGPGAARPLGIALLVALGAASSTGCGSVSFLQGDPSLPRDRASRFDRFVDELGLELEDTGDAISRIQSRGTAGNALSGAEREKRRQAARAQRLEAALIRLEGDFPEGRLDAERARTARILRADLDAELRRLDMAARATPLDRLAVTPWDGTLVEAPSILLREHAAARASDFADWETFLTELAALADEAGTRELEALTAPTALAVQVLADLEQLQESAGGIAVMDPFIQPLAAAADARVDSSSQRFAGSSRRPLGSALRDSLGTVIAGLEERVARAAPDDAYVLEGQTRQEWLDGLRRAAGENATPTSLRGLAEDELIRLQDEISEILDAGASVRVAFREIRERERPLPSDGAEARSAESLWKAPLEGLARFVAGSPKILVEADLARPFERPHGRWSPYVGGDLLPTDDPLARPSVYLVARERDPTTPYWLRDAEAWRYGVPGAAVADAFRRSAEAQPRLLRLQPRPAFVEGWSLYAVGAAADIGLLEENDRGFGRLTQELDAFALLICDIRLHADGWRRSDALAFLLENTPLTESAASERLLRIIARPGESTLPAIGLLRFRSLRRAVMNTLGDRFDEATFHAGLLRGGPIPMTEIDQRMRAWIQRLPQTFE